MNASRASRRPAREGLAWVAVAAFAFGALVAVAAEAPAGPTRASFDAGFDDPALAARYDALNRALRCLVCQNQSIADSNAALAVDLRRQVHEMLAAGRSDAEIADFMTARYGDYVLYQPRVNAVTALLWAGPFLLLGLAAALWWRAVRRRATLPDDGASA